MCMFHVFRALMRRDVTVICLFLAVHVCTFVFFLVCLCCLLGSAGFLCLASAGVGQVIGFRFTRMVGHLGLLIQE